MQDEQLNNELPDGWERCGDSLGDGESYPDPTLVDGEGGPLRPVAEHLTGATLLLELPEENTDGTRVVLSQQLTANGWRASTTTDSAIFTDDSRALAFINEVTRGISDGDDLLQAFAIVPHDGTTPTLVDGRIPTPADISDPQFADVFAIYTERTPDVVTANALRAVAQPVVELVYGTRTDIPEEVRELPSTTDAYDSAAIQVFTVSNPDLAVMD